MQRLCTGDLFCARAVGSHHCSWQLLSRRYSNPCTHSTLNKSVQLLVGPHLQQKYCFSCKALVGTFQNHLTSAYPCYYKRSMARHAAFRGHLCKPDWFCHLLYSFIWEEVTLTSGPQQWPTSWSFNKHSFSPTYCFQYTSAVPLRCQILGWDGQHGS